MSKRGYVVVVGCGRLGAHLANRLSRDGHSVVVIDPQPAAFDKLSPEFSGFRLEGDATELAVLKDAKLDQADAVIATTHADNVNLMVAQVAQRVFGVAQVLARVFDPRREEVYARLGVRTVSPTSVAAEIFLRAITTKATGARGELT